MEEKLKLYEKNFKNIKFENSIDFALSDLMEAFNYFKYVRDNFIKENQIENARIEQYKINIIINDERVNELFKANEFGFSNICDVSQVIKDREIIWPLILR
jgi:hypothetical protein